MTIKLLLLKSGEDIIADTTEMTVGEDEDRRVVGYFLNKPCVVKMRYPELLQSSLRVLLRKQDMKSLCFLGCRSQWKRLSL